MTTTINPPEPSALSRLINASRAKSASDSLAIEILHNLQYQHNWTNLQRHLVSLNTLQTSGLGLIDLDKLERPQVPQLSHSPSSSGTSTPSTAGDTVTLISGLPARHAYMHPDLQNHLVRHGVEEESIPIQREFVLPLSLGETWTLGRFCAVFDQLPDREMIHVQHQPTPNQRQTQPGNRQNGSATNGRPTPYQHHDQKRVLLGMKAREGGGGDGTVVYYIMQEGEVKPRQNG